MLYTTKGFNKLIIIIVHLNVFGMVVHRCGGWSARIRCTGGYPSSSSTTFNVNCILFFTHSWSEAHISGLQVIILPRLQLRTTSRVPTNCKRSTSSMSYFGASSCVSASLALPSTPPPTFKTQNFFWRQLLNIS